VIAILRRPQSNYGPRYYLNYAVWLRQLGTAVHPREEMCHIRMRADSVVSDDAQLTSVLDMDTNMPLDRRRQILETVMMTELIPFIDQSRTIDAIKKLIGEGRLRGAMVHAQARPLLHPSDV
jgi:hypothetical protein